jgi:hypothetical protein
MRPIGHPSTSPPRENAGPPQRAVPTLPSIGSYLRGLFAEQPPTTEEQGPPPPLTTFLEADAQRPLPPIEQQPPHGLPHIGELRLPTLGARAGLRNQESLANTHLNILADPWNPPQSAFFVPPGSKRQYKDTDMGHGLPHLGGPPPRIIANDQVPADSAPARAQGAELALAAKVESDRQALMEGLREIPQVMPSSTGQRTAPNPNHPPPISDHAAEVRLAHPPVRMQRATQPLPEKAMADRQAFMNALKVLYRHVRGATLGTAGVQAMLACEEFEDVLTAVGGLRAAQRESLVPAAARLVEAGHVTAGRLMCALWLSFGTGGAREMSPAELATLLPKDHNDAPMCPAAFPEAFRLARIADVERGGGAHAAEALELLRNPERAE